MSNVAVIIAPKGFQDKEYADTRVALEQGGHQVATLSSGVREAEGAFGSRVQVDKDIKEFNAEDVQGVVFIGGQGASLYFDHPQAHKIIREAIANKLVLGAICIAPVILAHAGALRGKRVTVWNGDQKQSAVVERAGAHYTGEDVVRDGSFVTANGPMAAHAFGKAIADILNTD